MIIEGSEEKALPEVKPVIVGKWRYQHKPWICPECGSSNRNSTCRKCFRGKYEKDI